MKKLLILTGTLVSLIAAQITFGQSNQGSITYDVKVNLHKRLPPERAEMKAMIPEFRTTKSQLFFTENESLSKPLIEDEEEEMTSGGPQIRIAQPNNEFYLNQSSAKCISKMEFMGKDYLITDSLKVSPWKFGTETKTIQGYVCKQAFYTDESIPDRKQEITAWYTDQIRPFLGPEKFNTLPGTVLAIDINNGERFMVASKIEFRSLKKNELKIPVSGQKITQEEFSKFMQEQMKKMGGGGIMIRH
ncbi:MAG: GLPGLI family protein [Flavobacteriales bacterium]